MKATVAVVVKDRRERMLECLEAILAQDHPDFEVVIVDNGSSDGTAEACRERAQTAPVPVRVEVEHGTLGHIRNHAARLARGAVVAFTDSDCTPQAGWLRAGVDALARDPSLGVICGATPLPHPPARAWARIIDVRTFSWRFETCNAFYRREALVNSDGFDEVVGDGWEDTAAGFAVMRAGWRAAFVPDAVVHHDISYPRFTWLLRREQRQANLGRIVRRYPEVRERLLFGRVFFNARGAASFFAFAGLVIGGRARVLALPYLPFLLVRVFPHRMVQVALVDLSLHVALIRGAVRYRTLLL